MADIKNIKEVVKALNMISLFIVKQVKDGLDFSDATALVTFLMQEEVQKTLKDAVEGISQIPEEFKDFELAEGLELATMAIAFVPQLIDALKK